MTYWIYSKDITRISIIADEPESYISILSLGIFLGLNSNFFDSMLQTCDLKMDEKIINTSFWSRFSFPFLVLVKLVELIPKENTWMRLIALLFWLKEESSEEDFKEEEDLRELELMTSDDLLNVRDYIKQKKLCNFLTVPQLIRIKEAFPKLLPVLDIEFLMENFIEKNKMKISCKICKLKSSEIKDFLSKKCIEKYQDVS